MKDLHQLSIKLEKPDFYKIKCIKCENNWHILISEIMGTAIGSIPRGGSYKLEINSEIHCSISDSEHQLKDLLR